MPTTRTRYTHLKVLAGALFAMTLILPSAVQAQQSAPSEASLAANRAEGDQILRTANAQAFFENVSDEEVVLLHHRASGLVCLFEPGQQTNNVRVYPVRDGMPTLGHDVGCGTDLGPTLTTYATRYEPTMTAEAAMDAAIAEIRAAWTEIEPVQAAFSVETIPDMADPILAVFKATHSTLGRVATVVIIFEKNGWIYKMRATGNMDEAEDLVLLSSRVLVAEILGME